jgi:hypothetical protein
MRRQPVRVPEPHLTHCRQIFGDERYNCWAGHRRRHGAKNDKLAPIMLALGRDDVLP